MQHIANNLYIGRLNGKGDVRLMHFKKAQVILPNVNALYDKKELHADVLIDCQTWISLLDALCPSERSLAHAFAHLHTVPTQEPSTEQVAQHVDAMCSLLALCSHSKFPELLAQHNAQSELLSSERLDTFAEGTGMTAEERNQLLSSMNQDVRA